MKLHLTEAQLLQEWRLRHFPEALNAGCAVTAGSGYDLDAILLARMRDWYSRLLAEGAPEMLAPVEIGDRLTLRPMADGSAAVTLPDSVARVMAVDMEGWKSPALIVADPAGRTALLQRSPYTRGGTSAPVAVIDGREMRLYTPPPGGGRLSVTAITDDGTTYHLDSAALSTIKPFLIS